MGEKKSGSVGSPGNDFLHDGQYIVIRRLLYLAAADFQPSPSFFKEAHPEVDFVTKTV